VGKRVFPRKRRPRAPDAGEDYLLYKVETLDAPNWVLRRGYEKCPKCGCETSLVDGHIVCEGCGWELE
jgi:hypothetical protein